jgi:hypothetical protein
LGWRTPFEKRHGVTPDISGYLVHHFYEPLYYLSHQAKFPKSTEKAGYWLNVAKNVGDALTFEILDDESGDRVTSSITRPKARSPHVNNRCLHEPNWDPFVLRDANNQNVPYKEMNQFSDKPVEVKRKYKVRRKPKEK